MLSLVLGLICFGGVVSYPSDNLIQGKFPPDFRFGISTSAYQIEGAWNVDGKGMSIWDNFTHIPGNTKDGATGDIADDSYYKYPQDIQTLKELGIKNFRFSISWPRILPDGTLDKINQAGIDHYNRVINDLLANGITPFVVLYHWDLPQKLQDNGGWLNETIRQRFADYSDLCFQLFGDRVDHWITFIEPFSISWIGYEAGTFAPGVKNNTAVYVAAHNIILSHAQVYHNYRAHYANVTGKIGISLDIIWQYPKTNTTENIAAAARALDFRFGWIANPLVYGDYPAVMRQQVDKKSKLQGLPRSRLPTFTPAQSQSIKGAFDFLGINQYTTQLVEYQHLTDTVPGYYNDQDAVFSVDPSWPRGKPDSQFPTVPWGMRYVLEHVRDTYNNPEVYITENGYVDCGTMQDQGRIDYIKAYSNNVLQAINSGCNVKGYFIWTLLDDFEWVTYDDKFGLYLIDYKSDERTRFARASAYFYAKLINTNGFDSDVLNFRAYPEDRDEFVYGKFPAGFQWGMATSAYQIEGAWNVDGKGPSIWDVFVHTPGNIHDNETADITCNSYYNYKEDVQMLKTVGVRNYRFSISWSRIMPDGTPSSLNAKGVAYYNNLINELLANGMHPMVTIYHWDLPQAFQQTDGGWLNDTIIDAYRQYADKCFELFGDRVKLWITFNEPWVSSINGYENGNHAPGISMPGRGGYIAAHNIIRSHAAAYHVYDTKYRATQGGKVGITYNVNWFEPMTFSAADLAASLRALEFQLGWWANPIFVNGDYPNVMKDYVAEKSIRQGFSESRLPKFTAAEMKANKGTFDFMGINHYSSTLVYDKPNTYSSPSYNGDQDIGEASDMCWTLSTGGWLTVNPWGMKKILSYIRVKYNNPPIYITENGMPDNELDDELRINYYTHYINQALKAVNEGSNLQGYTAWSLLDNFEWTYGYVIKFGLFQVNFTDPARTRTARKSVALFQKLIADNGFVKN